VKKKKSITELKGRKRRMRVMKVRRTKKRNKGGKRKELNLLLLREVKVTISKDKKYKG